MTQPQAASPLHGWLATPKQQTSRYFLVAVAANSGGPFTSQSALDIDVAPPGRPPSAHASVSIQETVYAATTFGSIVAGNATRSGAAISLFSDHTHLSLTVQGGFLMPGAFAALYRLAWQ